MQIARGSWFPKIIKVKIVEARGRCLRRAQIYESREITQRTVFVQNYYLQQMFLAMFHAVRQHLSLSF